MEKCLFTSQTQKYAKKFYNENALFITACYNYQSEDVAKQYRESMEQCTKSGLHNPIKNVERQA